MTALVVGDRFAVERVLGRGLASAVVSAIDRRSGARVALKLLDEARIAPAELSAVRAAFARESELQARLARAPRVLERSLDPPYFAMEYLEGTTLERTLDGGPSLSPARAVAVAMGCLESLAELHALGWVHADVTTSNVFLETRGATRLLDLGLAVNAGEPARGGTTAFAAPEQARGGAIDPRADVHAVGVVLFRAVTGRFPFAVEPIGAFYDALERAPRPAAEIDPVLDALLQRAMAPTPAERFPDANAMAAALGAWAAQHRAD